MVRKPVAAATATSSGGVVSSTVRWAREICRPVIFRLDYALDRAKGGRAMRMKNELYLGEAAVPTHSRIAGALRAVTGQATTKRARTVFVTERTGRGERGRAERARGPV